MKSIILHPYPEQKWPNVELEERFSPSGLIYHVVNSDDVPGFFLHPSFNETEAIKQAGEYPLNNNHERSFYQRLRALNFKTAFLAFNLVKKFS